MFVKTDRPEIHIFHLEQVLLVSTVQTNETIFRLEEFINQSVNLSCLECTKPKLNEDIRTT